MKVKRTKLEGLLIFEPDVFLDGRGRFFESWKQNAYQMAGIQHDFVQDNVSVSKKNVLRGLHYQKNQGQLVEVLFGKIYDVTVDIRPQSGTYGKYFATVLSDDYPCQIYSPPGFAHGFCVLSEIAVLHYKCTQYYSSKDEGGVLWNDPKISIPWPLKSPIVSTRDSRFPKLVDVPQER